MSSHDDTPISTLLAALLGLLVFLAAVAAANWWMARHWPLWLFVTVSIAWGIGAEVVKRAVKHRRQQRAKLAQAEQILRMRARAGRYTPGGTA